MTEQQRKRVAIYIRVSTLDQAKKGYGIPAQLRSLKKYIQNEEDNGWVYDKNLVYIDEGESGAKDERPMLDKMKDDIKLGKIDVVLVWKIDRLFRKTRYLLEIIEFFKRYSVEFASKNEKIDTSSSTGRLVITLLAAIAEMERDTFNERSILSKIAKSEDGYFVGGGHPYGYNIEKYEQGKRLVINEEEAEVVKKIFDMYVKQRKTQASIASELTNLGVPVRADSMNGKRKNSKNIGVWSQDTISNILKHTHYKGEYYYGRYIYKDRKPIKEKPEEDWIVLKCPSIISSDLFDRAVELRKLNQQNATKDTNNRYILVGKAKCGLCGYAYKGYPASKKPYFYYTCNGKYAKANDCKAKQISGNLIEGLIWDLITEMIGNPKIFTLFLKDKSDSAKNIKKFLAEIESLTDARNISENRKEKYYQDLGDPLLNDNDLKKYIKKEDQKIKDLEKLILEKEEFINNERTKEGLGESIQKLSNIYKEAIDSMTRDQMYELIGIVIHKIDIYDDKVEVYFKFNIEKPKVLELTGKKKGGNPKLTSDNYSGRVTHHY